MRLIALCPLGRFYIGKVSQPIALFDGNAQNDGLLFHSGVALRDV